MKNKKSVYISWLIIMLILYALFQNTFFGAIFLVMVCMGVISVAIAKVISLSVDIDFEKNISDIQVGERLDFGIIICNKSIFPTNKMYAKLKIKNFFFSDEDVCKVNLH